MEILQALLPLCGFVPVRYSRRLLASSLSGSASGAASALLVEPKWADCHSEKLWRRGRSFVTQAENSATPCVSTTVVHSGGICNRPRVGRRWGQQEGPG